MLFNTPGMLYIFSIYIIPYICSEYSPWVTYYMRVLSWFLVINGFANWFCVILYDPSYPKTKDNPNFNPMTLRIVNQPLSCGDYEGNRDSVKQGDGSPPDQFQALIHESINDQQNGKIVYDVLTKEPVTWDFCDKCRLHVPPRAYHCKICKKCILKRDHHCFLVGNCVGFKNQRYFIVYNFYVTLTCFLALIGTYKYLKEVYWPSATDWKDLLTPVAVWRWLFRNTESHICLMVFQIYIEIVFAFIGFFYFLSNLTMAIQGRTLFEVMKKVPVRNTSTVKENLRSVFGEFWLLNFIFPMTLIFRQEDDGMHWIGIKYDQKAKKEWTDDGELL